MSKKKRNTTMLFASLLLALTTMMPFGAGAEGTDGDSVTLAYQGLLGRAPTQDDIAYWSQASTADMVHGIIASNEFANTGIPPVSAVYVNMFGRQPSDAAWVYWTSGPVDQAIGAILDSDEMANKTGLDFKPSASKSPEQMIRETFPESPDFALMMAACESSMRPGAVGDSGASTGWFQIHWPSHHKKLTAVGITKEMLKEPKYNLIAARMVYDEAVEAGEWGWSPWSCA